MVLPQAEPQYDDILVPETKPATEWVNGRLLQKMSPRPRHALAQGRLVVALLAWSDDGNRGRVGPEMDFRFRPAGERWRLLVPDVAFISFDRLPEDADEDEVPRVPPEAAFEILSPGERFDDIADKIRVYLQCGVNVAVSVDARRRIFDVYRLSGLERLVDGATFTDDALPGLRIDVTEILGPDRAKR
jgi:Uma2 family endonuclease